MGTFLWWIVGGSAVGAIAYSASVFGSPKDQRPANHGFLWALLAVFCVSLPVAFLTSNASAQEAPKQALAVQAPSPAKPAEPHIDLVDAAGDYTMIDCPYLERARQIEEDSENQVREAGNKITLTQADVAYHLGVHIGIDGDVQIIYLNKQISSEGHLSESGSLIIQDVGGVYRGTVRKVNGHYELEATDQSGSIIRALRP